MGDTRPSVFVSYAGPDREIAAAVARTLEGGGIGVWWDDRLHEGEAFERQIQRALAQVQIVVAVLSPRTLASEWVRWELSQASRNGLHVLPLLVAGAEAVDLPPPLHLLPALAAEADGTPGPGLVAQVQARLQRMQRPQRPPEAGTREADARRRLASAAAQTAREAADIRRRKAQAPAPDEIVVRGSAAETAAAGLQASDGLAGFLHREGLSLAFSAFQNDTLWMVGTSPSGALVVDVQPFRQPTGLAVADGTLLVGTRGQLVGLRHILRPGQRLDGLHTHCFAPRVVHVTGDLDTHDVALGAAGEPVFVATRFNCLAAPSAVHSFRPLWRPGFISALVAEDRCHLNGVALQDGVPAWATAASTSDRCEGWRERRYGGVLIDVQRDAVRAEGLVQPHSPRVHDGHVWLLDSGRGGLRVLDEPGTPGATLRTVATLPGFTRGLALHGRYAFVGVSRPRYEGLGGAAGDWCGVAVVDTQGGEVLHSLRLGPEVRELYDVVVLPGVACARSVGPWGDDGLDLVTVEVSVEE